MTLSTKPLLILATLIITFIGVSACSSDSATPYVTPEASPVGFDYAACEFFTSAFALGLGVSLNDSRQGVRAVSAFKSPNSEDIWFIAADIEGPGNEGPGDIPIWWTRSDQDYLSFWTFAPANKSARLFNDIPAYYKWVPPDNQEPLGELPPETIGAELAEQCVLESLRQDPDQETGQELIRPGRWQLSAIGSPSLIVHVDAQTGECDRLLFVSVDGTKSKWEARILSNGDGDIDRFFSNVTTCGFDELEDESLLPEIDLDSIPEKYRKLIDS